MIVRWNDVFILGYDDILLKISPSLHLTFKYDGNIFLRENLQGDFLPGKKWREI